MKLTTQLNPPLNVYNLFFNTVCKHPSRLALNFENENYSYKQLSTLVDSRACELTKLGIGPGQAVVLLMPKSLKMIIDILALLKLEAIYVPLDIKTPEKRLSLILEELGPSLIVEEKDNYKNRDFNKNIFPAEIATILFTSGSTARPKGAMIPHSAITSFVSWSIEEVELDHFDRVVSVAPLFFDLSLFDLFSTFAAGAQLFIPPIHATLFPSTFVDFLIKNKITTWYSVPTFYMQQLDLLFPDKLTLSNIIFAGEIFPENGLKKLRTIFPKAKIWNWYGPTETNVVTSFRVPNKDIPFPLPLGRPTNYAQIVLSSEKDIIISGKSLMYGYVTNYLENKNTVFSSPIASYTTGDLGYWAEDQNLIFLGRKDFQIKSKGYRIELNEIRLVLEKIKDIDEVEVLAINDKDMGKKIICFLKCQKHIKKNEILKICKTYLPNYMIPEEIIFLDAFPVSSSGKKDLRALSLSAQ